MFGVSRRVSAAIAAAAMILVLSTSAVAAADPDKSAGAAVVLAIRSQHAAPSSLRLDHGGGLQPPATDVESTPFSAGAASSGIGVALGVWFLVFAGGVLASLRYMTRRSRL